jgi:rRNA-processing protein FCF1
MSKGKHFNLGRTRRDLTERQQKREFLDAARKPIDETPIDETHLTRNTDRETASGWVSRDKQKWYVIDTNLILSCIDVIYDPDDEGWRPPLDLRPSLDNAHIIIPGIVFEELNHIKDSHTVNCGIARKAFQRLVKFFPNSERSLQEIMKLSAPIATGWKQQKISILPLHRNFANSLPWVPDANDNDGWIAVTALAATMIRDGLPVDGTVSIDDVLERSNSRKDVILLTNDNPLRSKADYYGVRSKPHAITPFSL